VRQSTAVCVEVSRRRIEGARRPARG
jgi:hypothetical protein